jgi:hypothetical protein
VAQLAGARVGCGCEVLLECHNVLRCHLRPVIVTEEIGKAVEMGFPLLFRLRIVNPLFPCQFLDQRREGGSGGNGADSPIDGKTRGLNGPSTSTSTALQ